MFCFLEICYQNNLPTTNRKRKNNSVRQAIHKTANVDIYFTSINAQPMKDTFSSGRQQPMKKENACCPSFRTKSDEVLDFILLPVRKELRNGENALNVCNTYSRGIS